MSTLPNRLLTGAIALSILVPSLSVSQVKIKEKVEIRPRAIVASNASAELKFVFHWTVVYNVDEGKIQRPMHLGVVEPSGATRGFDVYTGLTAGIYSEIITGDYYDGPGGYEDEYQGEATYTRTDAQAGYYFLYGIADTAAMIMPWWLYYVEVYKSGQLDTTIDFGWHFTRVPDTRYKVVGEIYALAGGPVGPCGGIHFQFYDTPDLQHGETGYVEAQILDTCAQVVYDPPEHYFKFELLGDTLAGVLHDVDRGLRGTVLDSVASTLIEFDAWGKEPQSPTQVMVRISAENGSIPPATKTFTVLPPQMRAIAGKTILSYGDTTSLTLQVRNLDGPWTNKLEDWWGKCEIVQSDTFGFLYTLDSTQVDKSIDGWFAALNYYAHPETEPDSIEVLIQLVSEEPLELPMSIRSLDARNKTTVQQRPRAKALQLNVSSVAQKQPRAKILGGGVPSGGIHYGLARLKVKKKVVKILDHAPWTTWPYVPPRRGADRPGYNPKRSFRIQVLDASNQPVKDEQVRVMTSFEDRSGGHQHDLGTVSLPQPKQGYFYGQGKPKGNPLLLTTDQNGMAVVDSLVASQVSGKYLVTASLVADTTVKDTVNMEVKVPGLVNFKYLIFLQDVPDTLVQSQDGKSRHPDNDWCTAETGNSLYLVILDFYEWTRSEDGGASTIKTSINDMSLEFGGYFDTRANWDFDSSSPEHKLHRVGTSVDINHGMMDKEKLAKLTYYVGRHNGGRDSERPQIHYEFR